MIIKDVKPGMRIRLADSGIKPEVFTVDTIDTHRAATHCVGNAHLRPMGGHDMCIPLVRECTRI